MMRAEAQALATLHARHGRYPQATSEEDFRRNLAAVQQRIAAACEWPRCWIVACTLKLLLAERQSPVNDLIFPARTCSSCTTQH